MDWLKPLLPVLQTGLSIYAGGKLVKKSTEHAKDVAVRSVVIAFGGFTLLTFLTASIIMVFVDLGHQFESGQSTYFSGMMLSALCLTGLGVVLFGLCLVVAKILSNQEESRKEIARAEESPYAPLLVFGEELLKQLIANLDQKREAPRTAEPASTTTGAPTAAPAKDPASPV
jgi:cytochrome c biogenesis protein CcdA